MSSSVGLASLLILLENLVDCNTIKFSFSLGLVLEKDVDLKIECCQLNDEKQKDEK